jgi:hypothetical protein
MMTVRFPNGQAVQYNTATYACRGTNAYTDLYTRKDGAWIAQVPNTCIVEGVPACRVYQAIDGQRLAELTRQVALLGRRITKRKRTKRQR